MSWRDIQIERDHVYAIEYDREPQSGPVHEATPLVRRPAPIHGVTFSQIVIVDGKVRLVETSERPNYDTRHVRKITVPFVECLATA